VAFEGIGQRTHGVGEAQVGQALVAALDQGGAAFDAPLDVLAEAVGG
jgi:hypothetical protein